MNRFQDMSSNCFQANSRHRQPSNNRFHSNSRFKQDTSSQPSSGRFKSFTRDPKNTLNLPTNNRWKQDEPRESLKPDKFVQRRNPITKSLSHRHTKSPDEPPEMNSKFVNLNAISLDFNQITTKPKQNKKGKKKKQQQQQQQQQQKQQQQQQQKQQQQQQQKQQQQDDEKNNYKPFNSYTNETTTRKKYSKKYDLTEEQKYDLNSSIISQYNYEVIEESDSEGEFNGELNYETEPNNEYV
jgi:hypothetical protein